MQTEQTKQLYGPEKLPGLSRNGSPGVVKQSALTYPLALMLFYCM